MSNILKNLSIARFLTAAIAFAGLIPAKAAEAGDYRLAIEPLTINSYEAVEVPVLFETPDPCDIAAMQFDIVLPEKLEFAGDVRSEASRLADGHQFYASSPAENTRRVMIISMDQQNIIGNSGPIAYMTVRAKEGALSEDETVVITLTGVKLSDGTGTAQIVMPDATTEVAVRPHVAVTVDDTEFVLNPGNAHKISVSMENGATVKGLQLDIIMPKGFTVKDNQYVRTSRIASTATFQKRNTPNDIDVDGVTMSRYPIMIFDMSGQLSEVISGNSGEIFSFEILAPEDFTASEAKVSIESIVVSTPSSDGSVDISVTGEGTSITIVNGKAALDRAEAEIKALEDALAAALAQIAEEAADVKDDFTGTEISSDIAALRQAVEDAYTAGTLSDDYDNVMAPAAEISEAIEALVAAALDAQKAYDDEAARKAANEAAYNADVAALEALQTKLDATDADLKENYAGAYDKTDYDKIKAAIDNARQAIDDAYAAVAESGEYAGSVDTQAIDDMIEAWIAKTKASGIGSITVDQLEDVEAVYTLDGVRHSRPVSGEINIVVFSGGEMIKAYIER